MITIDLSRFAVSSIAYKAKINFSKKSIIILMTGSNNIGISLIVKVDLQLV